METISLAEHADVTSAEYAEELLTAADLQPYAARARDQLLAKFYGKGVTSSDMYDIISLAASRFRPELEELRLDMPSVYTVHRPTADKLFATSANIGAFLGLNLTEAIRENQFNTVYGRSSIDGLANIAVMVGAGFFDSKD